MNVRSRLRASNQHRRLRELRMTKCTKCIAAVLLAFTCAAVTARAQTTPPHMKMTTPIPPSITTPDSVDTSIGTLKFFDGFPDDATVQKAYDNLDFQRGVQTFLSGMPGTSLVGMR